VNYKERVEGRWDTKERNGRKIEQGREVWKEDRVQKRE
jgi:hypothetical protein